MPGRQMSFVFVFLVQYDGFVVFKKFFFFGFFFFYLTRYIVG